MLSSFIKSIASAVNELQKSHNMCAKSKKEIRELKKEKLELESAEKILLNRLKHVKEVWSSVESENKRLKKEFTSLGNRFKQIRDIVTTDPQILSEENKEKIMLLSSSSLDVVKNSGNKCKSRDSPSPSHLEGDFGISFDDTLAPSDSSIQEIYETPPVETRQGDLVTPSITSEETLATSQSSVIQNLPLRTDMEVQKSEQFTGPENYEDSSDCSIISTTSSVLIEHDFVLVSMSEWSVSCIPCGGKLAKNEQCYRCKACKAYCHESCREQMPDFCQPIPESAKNANLTTISECAPQETPMVPPVISFCLKKIEECSSVSNVYGVTPPEEDIQELLDQFSRGDDGASERKFDVSVLCGAVKVFLSRLADPLIPRIMKPDFLKIAELDGLDSAMKKCYELVQTLPQANRHTLASVILHMDKLCKDSPQRDGHLIQTFAPILFGPNKNPSGRHFSTPRRRKAKEDETKIVRLMLTIDTEFWREILKSDNDESDDSIVIVEESEIQGDSKAEEVSLPSGVPAYSNVFIPYPLFRYVLDLEEECSLDQYVDHLASDDEVPYMLTEYIRDKNKQSRIREHLRPARIPKQFRQLILERQPELSYHFSHLTT